MVDQMHLLPPDDHPCIATAGRDTIQARWRGRAGQVYGQGAARVDHQARGGKPGEGGRIDDLPFAQAACLVDAPQKGVDAANRGDELRRKGAFSTDQQGSRGRFTGKVLFERQNASPLSQRRVG